MSEALVRKILMGTHIKLLYLTFIVIVQVVICVRWTFNITKLFTFIKQLNVKNISVSLGFITLCTINNQEEQENKTDIPQGN